MIVFKINDMISLKLENKETNIYVNGKLFRNCKAILLNIPSREIPNLHDINSIDEAVEKLERERINVTIPPHVEFWAHCSNIQTWAELNYDSNILNYMLAFPLLKELATGGDPTAKNRFKSEIVKRLELAYIPIIHFFITEGYFYYFSNDEKTDLWDLVYNALSASLDDICDRDDLSRENVTFLTLSHIIHFNKNQKKKADSLLKDSFKKLFERGHRKSIQALIDDSYLHDYFSSKELLSLLFNSKSPFTKKIIKFFQDNPQSKSIFEKCLREMQQLDKEQMEKIVFPRTKDYSIADYIIGIISVVIDPDINKLYFELKEEDEDEDFIFEPIPIPIPRKLRIEDFSPVLSEELVMGVLTNDWLSHEEICSRLSIKDPSDTIFIKNKLKILKRKEIVSFKIIENENFWKLNE